MDKQNWPAWFYGPNGQSQIFNGPLEVPDGWHDSPDKFDADGKEVKGAHTEIPDYEEAKAAAEEEEARVADAEDEDGETDGLPSYDRITVKTLKDRLDERGSTYAANASKRDLYDQLQNEMEADDDLPYDPDHPAIDHTLTGALGQDLRPERVAPEATMTDGDINGRLSARNVEFDPDAPKAERYALLLEHLLGKESV